MSDDRAYYERRSRLHRALLNLDTATAAQLASVLGWDLREVSAKLQGLRRDGLADRADERGDVRLWWAK
jgi:predicted ArsR family transcriptional regulator